MKTQEQKLQHVMEAAGECWCEYPITIRTAILKDKPTVDESVNATKLLNTCEKCGAYSMYREANPSPDDLNELFRLAEKLGYNDADFYWGENKHIEIYPMKSACGIKGYGATREEALLNALFIATGGIE